MYSRGMARGQRARRPGLARGRKAHRYTIVCYNIINSNNVLSLSLSFLLLLLLLLLLL